MNISSLKPMKKNIQIAIAQPCHENWNSFTKTSKGGFCSSCQKEVIDFTSWSDEQLKLYFKNLPINTCGRFRARQLKVYAYENRGSTRYGWLSIFFASIMLSFTSRQSLAQRNPSKHPTEQYQEERIVGEVSSTGLPAVHVSGVVRSPEERSLMPGVNVVLKGTMIGTTTDVDGNFALKLENLSTSPVLVFSFIGFRSVEYPLDATTSEQVLQVDMMQEVMQLGGIVVGGVTAYQWYNPRTWWWKVRGVFSRR